MGRRPKDWKQDDLTGSTVVEATCVQMDPLTKEIFLSLLANSRVYSGMASEDNFVIKTACRVRAALADERLAEPAIDLSKK